MIGNCPKCGVMVGRVNVSPVELHATDRAMKGAAYLCQACNCVLSVSIDPIAHRADIVSEVLKALAKG